jgi:beta-lactamase superfamily II metal-dependent hydrolase
MSIIKSFSVGNGDMFYIDHNSDNFSIIDCYFSKFSDEDKETIANEITGKANSKGISRFISTHPDDDHIGGLKYLNEKMNILNFYCVKNEATKDEETDDFKKYCELRDSDKAFYIEKGCSRKWMNRSDDERGSSGISILWPITDNEHFKNALEESKKGQSPNNISPIIRYSLENGVKVLWMGDLENKFMEAIKDDLDLEETDIIFAPHHGRNSGKIPSDLLKKLNPKIIIVGEADSEDLNYYAGYNTITQNSAGDIIFECLDSKVNIYVSSENYEVNFLDNENGNSFNNYIGTLKL